MAHFPKMEISKERAEVMFEFLSDLTPGELAIGVEKFCKVHSEIYPNTNIIAHIRRYALVDEVTNLTGWEAWELVLDAIRKVGGIYGVPKISDQLVQKTVNIIGWKDICSSSNPEAVRAHFVKAYESLVEHKHKRLVQGVEQ